MNNNSIFYIIINIHWGHSVKSVFRQTAWQRENPTGISMFFNYIMLTGPNENKYWRLNVDASRLFFILSQDEDAPMVFWLQLVLSNFKPCISYSMLMKNHKLPQLNVGGAHIVYMHVCLSCNYLYVMRSSFSIEFKGAYY